MLLYVQIAKIIEFFCVARELRVKNFSFDFSFFNNKAIEFERMTRVPSADEFMTLCKYHRAKTNQKLAPKIAEANMFAGVYNASNNIQKL